MGIPRCNGNTEIILLRSEGVGLCSSLDFPPNSFVIMGWRLLTVPHAPLGGILTFDQPIFPSGQSLINVEPRGDFSQV